MADVKFGTSGVRGLAAELTDAVCRGYMRAFLRHMAARHGLRQGAAVLTGQDLRASSPRLAAAAAAEICALGFQAVNCGQLPTPALALAALSRRAAAVMITGSHIPEDRNGLKFYRPDGEIDKEDEAAIARLFAGGEASAAAAPSAPAAAAPQALPALQDSAARQAYIERWTRFLPRGSLKGLRIGIYQHSTVARDIMAEIAAALGAETALLHRSEKFIPVDTEALRAEDKAIARAAAQSGFDALISADGDGDRPLLADENGEFIRGDSLGILTAHFLQADYVVTPITTSTALELSGFFPQIIRCRVGSPFVLAGMAAAQARGGRRILGFEANGGVLLGSAVGALQALPTRDAMLPILSVLQLAQRRGCRLSALRGLLPRRAGAADRLQNFAPAAAAQWLAALRAPQGAARLLPFGAPQRRDETDGLRLFYANGEIIHFRASGNAPELRCYSEAAESARAEALLAAGLAAARAFAAAEGRGA